MAETNDPSTLHAPISASAALAFLVEAGCDEAIDEVPQDRLRKLAPPVAPGARSSEPLSRRNDAPSVESPQAMATRAPGSGQKSAPPPLTNVDAIASARRLARAATTLDELEAALDGFDSCALKATATRLVFADGVPGSDLMIIGEAPGRDEDLEGRPFVGRSGQLLDRMLAAIGLDRSKVYIANVVPWRPPGNRKPTAAEAAMCRPFLDRQIALAAPKLILMLGGAATSTLLDREEGILRLRGRFYDLQTDIGVIPALASLHPAYLLRANLEKRLAWRDFLALKVRLAAL